MSTGLATRRILDRHARQQQRAEWRAMELVAGLVVIALVAIVGTVGVLCVGAVADKMAGFSVVGDALVALRGAL